MVELLPSKSEALSSTSKHHGAEGGGKARGWDRSLDNKTSENSTWTRKEQ
jgi:hypothetical protein